MSGSASLSVMLSQRTERQLTCELTSGTQVSDQRSSEHPFSVAHGVAELGLCTVGYKH